MIAIKRPPLSAFRHPGALLRRCYVSSDLGRGDKDRWETIALVRVAIPQRSTGSSIIEDNDRLRQLSAREAWIVHPRMEITTEDRLVVYGNHYQITEIDDLLMRQKYLRIVIELME